MALPRNSFAVMALGLRSSTAGFSAVPMRAVYCSGGSMRFVLLVASIASMVSLESIPGQAMPVYAGTASRVSATATAIACSSKHGCRARRATIENGRIKQKGCNKKIGAGLRTPC